MYSFCPHCGMTLEQDQREGQLLICIHCGKEIGVVPKKPQPAAPIAVIPPGAARCPVCRQAVALKANGGTLAPHYGVAKKICPGSGKPA